MELTNEFKQEVRSELLKQRKNYSGSDSAFAKQYGINASIFSRLQKGETERVLSEGQWLNVGRLLDVTVNRRKWNAAKTEVFSAIEEDVLFCKNESKGRIFVDDCGIGKTFTAKYLSKTLKNCFYIDASQAKTKNRFIKLLARTIGIDSDGRIEDIKDNIKYYIRLIPTPVIIVDEAGDLQYDAFLELKGIWNGTENACGWYLMGADGLRAKIERGISNKKVGYRELFSRLSDKYSNIVPPDRSAKMAFYRKLITDVLSANSEQGKNISAIVDKCLVQVDGNISGLRRAESLLILSSYNG